MNIFEAELQHILVTWSWLFWILSQYVFFSTTASRFSPLFNKHFFTPFSSLENRNDFFGKGNFVLRLKTGITSARGSVGDDERWSSWWWKRTFQTTAYRDWIILEVNYGLCRRITRCCIQKPIQNWRCQ